MNRLEWCEKRGKELNLILDSLPEHSPTSDVGTQINQIVEMARVEGQIHENRILADSLVAEAKRNES